MPLSNVIDDTFSSLFLNNFCIYTEIFEEIQSNRSSIYSVGSVKIDERNIVEIGISLKMRMNVRQNE